MNQSAQLALGHRLIDEIKEAPTMESLETQLSELALRCGFSSYAYVGFDQAMTARSVTNYPSAWIELYRAKNFTFRDPILASCRRAISPFLWTSENLTSYMGDPEDEFLGAAMEHGIRSGATIPIHFRGQEFGAFCVTSTLSGDDFVASWSAQAYFLQVVGYYVHSRLTSLDAPSESPVVPALTPRQKEVLLWSARGKSASEVADILELSYATVRSYLREACERLGTYGKVHAVTKAILYDLISPMDPWHEQ